MKMPFPSRASHVLFYIRNINLFSDFELYGFGILKVLATIRSELRFFLSKKKKKQQQQSSQIDNLEITTVKMKLVLWTDPFL